MSTSLLAPKRALSDVPAKIPPPGSLQREDAAHFGLEAGAGDVPTYLHPFVITATAGGYAWCLLAFWEAFAGYGYMTLALIISTLISLAMLGSIAAGGMAGRDMTPWQRRWLSFREFLSSEVEVGGVRVLGRDAFLQLAGMSWCLAGLATAFAIIVAFARP